MRLWWLIAALLLCSALLGLHWVGMENFLYWRYEWYDIPVHFLGGLSLGVLGVGLLHVHRPAALALFVVIAFAAWEIFEVVFGLPLESNYVSDTALDLVMDSSGAFLAYVAARMTIWKA